MPIRPVNEDVLTDIAMGIARKHYGFLYVDRVGDEIKERYQSTDTGLINAGSVTRSDIKETLGEVSDRSHENFVQIRPGVYYYDLFKSGHDNKIPTELKNLFVSKQQVITAEQVRNTFNLAVDDVDFFIDKLVENDMLISIAAGGDRYYSVGSLLKEQTGQNRLEEELAQQSRSASPMGILYHEDLEDIISVSATSKVIHYLERELGMVADLDGQYLVWEAVADYGRWMAEQLHEDIEKTFDDAGLAMPRAEYRDLVIESSEGETTILSEVSRSDRDRIIDAVQGGLAEVSDIHVDGDIAVHREPFEDEVEAHADDVVRPILADSAAATTSILKEDVNEEIEELRIAESQQANTYLRQEVRDRAYEKIEEAI